MRLGTETGSPINHVMATSANHIKPLVGMAVTICMWSDRRPGTIVKVHKVHPKGKQLWIQEDDHKVISGSMQDGSAKYEYTPNISRPLLHYKFSKSKQQWIEAGPRGKGWRLRLGTREYYCDPHF